MPRKFAIVATLLAAVGSAPAQDDKKAAPKAAPPAEAKKADAPAAPKAEPPKAEAKAEPPAAAPAKADAPKPNEPVGKAKASEALGLNFGRVLRGQFGETAVDGAAFAKGFNEGLAGKGSMTFEQIVEMVTKYKSEIQKNYLEDNKKKPGVKVTASGLQYEVLTAGKGDKSPTKDQTVKVHYTGTLTNGKKFDSSVDRGTPAEFGVGGVIKGWTEALQMMKVGDKWKLTIPAEIAYGAEQKGEDIPPNSTLVFDVELLEIK